MKTKNIVLTILAFVLTSLIGFAQMGGMHQNGSGGMGSQHQSGAMIEAQHSQQMMGGQMTGRDMMLQMSGMMQQMNGMLQQMTHTMSSSNMTSPAHMQDMSQIMSEMSATMSEMAGQMANGKMEPAAMQNLQTRVKTMSQMMKGLSTTSNVQK